MHQDLFLQKFGHLIHEKDGIKKLRDLILQLAVQGKLVPQDPNDKNWKIAAISEVFELIDGDRGPNYPKKLDYKEEGYCLFLSTKNVRPTGFLFDDLVFITEEKHNQLRKGVLIRGDIIITTRGTIGNSAFFSEEIAFDLMRINSGMLILRPLNHGIDGYFITLCIQSPFFKAQIEGNRSGSAQPQLPGRVLKEFKIPLPPLAEQKRIVAKVDELMALCDQLQEQQDIHQKLKQETVNSTLHHMTTAPTKADLVQYWSLTQTHFHDWFKQPQTVKKLRETILQLAVQGKLVPQDPNDEPASELLKKIAKEKERLIVEGIIKKQRATTGIAETELYKVPENWLWAKLENISSYIQRGKGPKYVTHSNVPVISQKCVQWSGFDISVAKFIDEETLEKYQRERFLQKGDLLWNSTGTGTIGRVNVFPGNVVYEKSVADSHVTVVRLIFIEAMYAWIYLASPFIQNQIEGKASGTTNQIELNTSTVKLIQVPLPPLAEQKRIVAKVDELMALCDQLEQQIDNQSKINTDLMASLVHHVTHHS